MTQEQTVSMPLTELLVTCIVTTMSRLSRPTAIVIGRYIKEILLDENKDKPKIAEDLAKGFFFSYPIIVDETEDFLIDVHNEHSGYLRTDAEFQKRFGKNESEATDEEYEIVLQETGNRHDAWLAKYGERLEAIKKTND